MDTEKEKQHKRNHYANNKEQYLQRNREKRERLKAFLKEYKANPCVDCGVSYPHYVMDLDHRDPSTKSFNPARLVNMGSWVKLQEEIAKCDLVCANCHRRRTYG